MNERCPLCWHVLKRTHEHITCVRCGNFHISFVSGNHALVFVCGYPVSEAEYPHYIAYEIRKN